MFANYSDFSFDSEEEEELEWLYIQFSFCNKIEKGQKVQYRRVRRILGLIAYVMDSK